MYFESQTQRTEINNCFSKSSKVGYGVPQGSRLGPLLFNINLIDMFYECGDSNIENYVDDTTPYTCTPDTNTVISIVQSISNFKLFTWFKNNHMKANPQKYYLSLISETPIESLFGGSSIKPSTKDILLGVLIDSEFCFDEHISVICTRVSRTINSLSRITNFMSCGKRRLIMKAFIVLQLNYCPLIWMFHSRTLNNKINRLHKRALRIAYSDFKSSFNELLEQDNSFTIYHRNIQSLSIEIYKFLNGLSPSIMSNVFKQNQSIPYELRTTIQFEVGE